jgi:hypothetical protein
MDPLEVVLLLPKAARLTSMEAAVDHKMSVEDFSVSPPSHRRASQTFYIATTFTSTHSTHEYYTTIIHALTTPESTLHQTTITTGAKRIY